MESCPHTEGEGHIPKCLTAGFAPAPKVRRSLAAASAASSLPALTRWTTTWEAAVSSSSSSACKRPASLRRWPFSSLEAKRRLRHVRRAGPLPPRTAGARSAPPLGAPPQAARRCGTAARGERRGASDRAHAVAAHKSWSVQLHYDNLVALAATRHDLRPLPCYDTLRRPGLCAP